MKGNFMIQAELDIARHPEWGEYERWECLKRASVKERQLKWKLDTKKNFNLDTMRYPFGLYANQFIKI